VWKSLEKGWIIKSKRKQRTTLRWILGERAVKMTVGQNWLNIISSDYFWSWRRYMNGSVGRKFIGLKRELNI
jgi:hypothetical protein